jgi:hypothetical protein
VNLNGSGETKPRVGDLVPFDDWLKSIRKSRVTGWNYRRRGMISVVNVLGRLYVTRSEIARFESRATSGEFARHRNAVLKVENGAETAAA